MDRLITTSVGATQVRAGEAPAPHPGSCGLTLGQRGPVQQPVQEERRLEGPPLGDVDGAGGGGCLVQGLGGPQLEEGLHGPGQAGPLRQVRLGQRGARGIQPALELQPCSTDPLLGSQAGLPGRLQTPRVCLGETLPGSGSPKGRGGLGMQQWAADPASHGRLLGRGHRGLELGTRDSLPAHVSRAETVRRCEPTGGGEGWGALPWEKAIPALETGAWAAVGASPAIPAPDPWSTSQTFPNTGSPAHTSLRYLKS